MCLAVRVDSNLCRAGVTGGGRYSEGAGPTQRPISVMPGLLGLHISLDLRVLAVVVIAKGMAVLRSNLASLSPPQASQWQEFLRT